MWYKTRLDFTKKIFRPFFISLAVHSIDFWWKIRWQKNFWVALFLNYYSYKKSNSLYKKHYYDMNSFGST